MRYFSLFLLLSLTGCASFPWVDLDDCKKTMKVEGHTIGKCREVDVQE